jgi:sorting and assembly machinery component 37
MESRGQPLLDLSLFVSSENYTEWTRPALAQILQWPHQWIIPHRLRDEAKIRSQHLGLSSLDIDNASEEDGNKNSRGTGNIPKHLLTKPKETVGSLMGKSGSQNQFRLGAVTADFFEPLCDLVERHGSRSWVFGTDTPSSLDCLLLGYLSLMCTPLMPPHPFLLDALSKRYPNLLQWTRNFRQECFGGPIRAADILPVPTFDPAGFNKSLPWHARAPISKTKIGLTVLSATLESLPVASRFRSDRIVPSSSRGGTKGTGETTTVIQTPAHPTYSRLGVAGITLGMLLLHSIYVSFLSPNARERVADHTTRRRMARSYGEAGRMLGLGQPLGRTH